MLRNKREYIVCLINLFQIYKYETNTGSSRIKQDPGEIHTFPLSFLFPYCFVNTEIDRINIEIRRSRMRFLSVRFHPYLHLFPLVSQPPHLLPQCRCIPVARLSPMCHCCRYSCKGERVHTTHFHGSPQTARKMPRSFSVVILRLLNGAACPRHVSCMTRYIPRIPVVDLICQWLQTVL